MWRKYSSIFSLLILSGLIGLNCYGRKQNGVLGIRMGTKIGKIEEIVASNKIVAYCLIVLLIQSLESIIVEELFVFGRIEDR